MREAKALTLCIRWSLWALPLSGVLVLLARQVWYGP